MVIVSMPCRMTRYARFSSNTEPKRRDGCEGRGERRRRAREDPALAACRDDFHRRHHRRRPVRRQQLGDRGHRSRGRRRATCSPASWCWSSCACSSEMAIGDARTSARSPSTSRLGLGDWAGFVERLAVLVFLGRRRRHRSDCRRGASLHEWIDLPVWQIGLALMLVAHRREPAVLALLWRVRVLVLLDQGRGDRRSSS